MILDEGDGRYGPTNVGDGARVWRRGVRGEVGMTKEMDEE